jgi:hypothetical protein
MVGVARTVLDFMDGRGRAYAQSRQSNRGEFLLDLRSFAQQQSDDQLQPRYSDFCHGGAASH